MMLVLLGTQPHKFTRLLNYIDDLANEGIVNEQIIVQLASNNYKFTNKDIKLYDYLPNFEQAVKEANIIIAHGGVGIIMKALEENKRLIVVPRKKDFNEHIDNHQEEICQKFVKENYIMMCITYEQLKEAYLSIEKKEIKKYEFNNNNFNIKLNQLIDELI